MNTLLVALKDGVLSQEQLDSIRQRAGRMEVVQTRDKDRIRQLLPAVEVAFGTFPRELLGAAKSLKWYQQWSAGADWLLREPAAAEADFVLTNTSGVHAVPIAEHVLAFMLAFARGFPEAMRNQAAASWPARPPEVIELAGRTLLLVGVGRIGERVALLAQALGMRVVGVRRSQSDLPPGVSELGTLQELLPRADFVVLTVPLTEATRHMIGTAELALMKPDSYLINIGRGGTVDETALFQALSSGRIGGAGLDVFEEEPLPAGSEFWSLPNVLVTTHYSGDTPEYANRSFGIFMDNLERYLAGQPLQNVVDKKAGY